MKKLKLPENLKNRPKNKEKYKKEQREWNKFNHNSSRRKNNKEKLNFKDNLFHNENE